MPPKTIYVKDADLATFDAAEKLGDGESLSQIIAEALRRFVAVKEAEARGMQEYTLEVGTWGHDSDDVKAVKFIGRLLSKGRQYTGQTSDRRDRWTEYELYQTQAGKILIYSIERSLWEKEYDSATYYLYDTLPNIDIPASLLKKAAEALGQTLVEWID